MRPRWAAATSAIEPELQPMQSSSPFGYDLRRPVAWLTAPRTRELDDRTAVLPIKTIDRSQSDSATPST